MADKNYNYEGQLGITTLVMLIKNKIKAVDAKTEIADTVTETGTKAVKSSGIWAFVKDEISKMGGISFVKVDTLPESGEAGKIYLVPQTPTTTSNIYDEYIWFENKWEKIGSTAMDLSGYVKKEDMHELTAEEVTTLFNAAWGSDD